jgi:hypothetical protein
MDGILKTCTYRKQLFVCLIFSLLFLTTTAQNPIATENALPGSPKSEWDIDGAGDLSIQGFATDISVNKGNRINFKIDTDASDYTITIYRLGYYGGLGARNWGNGVITATLPQNQPDPIEDPATGIVDCGNWDESAYWDVPANAVSGIYIALLNRTDNNAKSHITFIVRDDASTADIFFQASDATWQAYNAYGGASLYNGTTSFPAGHAVKVSYNRPFLTRDGGGGGGPGEDFLYNAEYPMIRFLERNGYDIAYTTNLDMARDGSRILQHKVFLSVGHDEYWSAEQRTAVENARAAGVHLAFFSGNEVYWKTRWENSVDGNNTTFRTLVCYKEGDMGEIFCGNKCDPSPEWTGLWRTPMGEGFGGNRPENALTGQISWGLYTDVMTVPATYRNLRFWRNTSVASMGPGDTRTLPYGVIGYEYNYEMPQYAGFNPPGRMLLSRTNVNGDVHKMSLYRHSSGALVFGAGTVQYAWGLDNIHDRGNEAPDPDLQQATINLLADMGAQPTTLMPGMVAATQTTDNTKPISIISSPINGASVPVNQALTIEGTASDNAEVATIELSLDGGTTWQVVSEAGTTWQFTWTPTSQGNVTIKVRAVDDSGNIENEGTAPAANAITITVGAAAPAECPCTVFEPVQVPDENNLRDAGGINGIVLGMRFQPEVDGFINAIRFYKSSNNTDVHTGKIWSNTGTMLAEVTFTGEPASGWVEQALNTPLAVTANTVYVVSYHSPTGYYSKTGNFFSSDVVNSPLIAPQDGSPAGSNGAYIYSSSHTFPNTSFQADNYWVDVVFDNELAPDTDPPGISSSKPVNGGTNFAIDGSLTVRFDEAMDASTITSTTLELRDAANVLVACNVSYNAGNRTASITPEATLSYSSVYTFSIKSGALGVKDLAGNEMGADSVISFSTVDPPPGNPGDGPGGPILVIHSASNPFSRYTAEILRAEGLNEFNVLDISAVDANVLLNYDVVILGEVAVDAAQATLFSDFVDAGGTFIAFKPDSDLETLLGITNAGGSLSDKYLLINTAHSMGAGLVNQTIQFHSAANQYNLNGALSLATLYSDASTATAFPAVTLREVGSNGGKAVAFAYDLPKSIVYTRQGNPAWAGQKRDGTFGPIRAGEMFLGTNGDPDWIDFNKVSIPQADEQQRLLGHIITKGNLHKKPLPKFWFLPQGFKAAVVMTGDDHAEDGTSGRFDIYKSLGPNTQQDVKDWKAVRSTSYIYSNTPISDAVAAAYEAEGFEIALHPSTDCQDWDEASLNFTFTSQRASFLSEFPSLLAPVTSRTHCMAWSEWATQAEVSVQNGVRLDVNYYYWPEAWIQNRPGMFTGSGMPMRFANLDGSLIDVYQVVTQLTDESAIDYGLHISSLLDKALGAEGYYGVFCANMHTDSVQHIGSTAIVNAALARNVPVISSRQMLNWLDGRNGSSFSNLTWNGNDLNFTINALINAYKMKAMLPIYSEDGILTGISRDGQPATYTVETIKGTQYAFFDATNGNYVASYAEIQLANINGSVTLQGRPAAPNAQWEVPLKVDFYANGNNTTPAYTFNVTTDQSGNFSISNIPVGTYSIAVKNAHTLRRVLTGQTLVVGNNALNFGTLLEGDVNNNNVINALDLSAMLSSYLKVVGDLGYNPNADLNNNQVVNALDLSALFANYLTAGENP